MGGGSKAGVQSRKADAALHKIVNFHTKFHFKYHCGIYFGNSLTAQNVAQIQKYD